MNVQPYYVTNHKIIWYDFTDVAKSYHMIYNEIKKKIIW